MNEPTNEVTEAMKAIGEDWATRTMTIYAAAKVLEAEVKRLQARNAALVTGYGFLFGENERLEAEVERLEARNAEHPV